jgi:hypothetical protein
VLDQGLVSFRFLIVALECSRWQCRNHNRDETVTIDGPRCFSLSSGLVSLLTPSKPDEFDLWVGKRRKLVARERRSAEEGLSRKHHWHSFARPYPARWAARSRGEPGNGLVPRKLPARRSPPLSVDWCQLGRPVRRLDHLEPLGLCCVGAALTGQRCSSVHVPRPGW